MTLMSFLLIHSTSISQQFSMIKDLNLGIESSDPNSFTDYNGELWFNAYTPANGYCLYKTDGSLNGTTQFYDLLSSNNSIDGYYVSWYDFVNGKLLHHPWENNKIWFSNGTTAGTYPIFDVASFFPNSIMRSSLKVIGQETYFILSEQDPIWGNTIHRLCKANLDFSNVSVMYEWTNTFGQYTFFVIEDIGNSLLIASGSTGDGTWSYSLLNSSMVKISSDPTYSQCTSKVEYGSKIYYTRYGNLYSVDGTASNTILNNFMADNLTLFDNQIYFSGGTVGAGLPGIELYKTDGTLGNTSLVSDVFFGYNSSSPHNFKVVNDKLFFQAHSEVLNGHGIYCFQPNTNLQVQVFNEPLLIFYDAIPAIGYNDKLFFSAPTNSQMFWKLHESSGFQNDAIITQNINSTLDSACLNNFYVVNSHLFFTACDSLHGLELWSSVTNFNELQNSNGSSILISPNPFNTQIKIEVGQEFYGLPFIFRSTEGKIVFHGVFSDPKMSLDVSHLKQGMYFLQIGHDELNTFKIMKN
jgi:ELWxxDGT repeat protein